MAEIMAKFRIRYTSLKMVDDISVQPKQETLDFFDKLISDFRKNEPDDTGTLLDYIYISILFEMRSFIYYEVNISV